MLSEKRLRIALKTVALISLDGPFHRFADFWFVNERLARGEGSGVLEGIGARMWGGRFTPPGIFETLYVSLSAEAARIEAESVTLGPGIVGVPARPFVHFVINGRLARVLDLTDAAVQGTLGTTSAELCAPWRMVQARRKQSLTQRFGRAAHGSNRVEAVLYQSTKDAPLGRCLAIFPDRLAPASWLEIVDETGRLKSERL